MKNFHVVLLSKPGANSEPTTDNFGYEECDYPADQESGEILVKTLYLSVDPVLRSCLHEDTGVDYIQPWKIGDTILGSMGVGIVVKSETNAFSEGDIITGAGVGWPWYRFFKINPASLQIQKVPKEICGENLTLPLSLLGIIGLTAYLGVEEKGNIKADENQTFVVSGAAGACGTVAGQIAKLKGCTNIIGICGSDEKCTFLTKELSFDHAINYKTENVEERLKTTCPEGIDVYFDNVGGSISDTIIKQMNKDSHVILCGQVATYNKTSVYPPPIPDEIVQTLKDRNITRDRFLVLNYADKFEETLKILAMLYSQGKIKVRETIEEGLENSGKAFISMMNGGNIGKQLVHVADP